MGGFTFNPILSEIQGHFAAMSPEAQGAVKMAGMPPPDATMTAPGKIAPGMLLPHPDAGPPPAPIGMESQSPPLTMPSTAPQLVAGPKRGQAMMTNGQQVPLESVLGRKVEGNRLAEEGSGIDQISGKIQNSRLGEAHPFLGKLLGGLAQGAATAGDIALRVGGGGMGQLAEQMIPGTAGHHQLLVNQNARALGQDVTNAQKEATTAETQARVPLTQAQTAKTTEETAEAPAKAANEEGLQGAQTAHLGAETAEMASGKPMETSAGLLQVKPDGTAQAITVNGQPVGPPIKTEVKQFEVNGKPHQVLINSLTGDHLRDMGESGEHAAQAPGITMIVPNAQGGGTVERIGVGGTVAPGAQTAQGVNAVNTPTMTQRTAAGRAGTVVAMAPEVLARIDALAPKLGPVEGRWNEFMQGKVGMNDPDFAALRSDLLMMSSAVALAHAQGRLPENLREEFDRAINAPKQTPANLKATIQTMIPWLTQMQNQLHPGNNNAQQPPASAGATENWVRGADGKLVKQ